MALIVTQPSRTYSIGPVKQATLLYTTVSGDTTGSFTVAGLSVIELVQVDGGMILAAAPTINNAVTPPTVTMTWSASPTAGNFGTLTVHGK